MLRWITAFGPPAILQNDNGLEFWNGLITGLAAEYNFKITHGRPYHPQAQGIVEQGNGSGWWILGGMTGELLVTGSANGRPLAKHFLMWST